MKSILQKTYASFSPDNVFMAHFFLQIDGKSDIISNRKNLKMKEIVVMKLKKIIHSILLIIILGVTFGAFINSANSNVVKATTTTMNSTSSINVNDGDSIIFNHIDGNVERTINVYGSGTVTFNITFDNYSYTASSWSGSMSIKQKDSNTTRININVTVIGTNSLQGDNHPGLRLPNDVPIYFTFYMLEDSQISFSSRNGSPGISNGSNTLSNLNFDFYNVSNTNGVIDDLQSKVGRQAYTLVYSEHVHEHDIVHHDAQAPTCENVGWEAYDTCSTCDYTTYVAIPALGHDWGEVTYTWDADHTHLTATHVCSRNGSHQETETVEVIHEVTTQPTCLTKGVTTYTSLEFINPEFEVQSIALDDINPVGHTWSEVTYTWNEDHSQVTATRICLNDPDHIETETVSATCVEIAPTCLENGLRTYTSGPFENKAFIVQIKQVVVEAMGHAWDEVTYTWNATNTQVTATRVCLNDPSHIETETVSATYVRVEPTCTETGLITYTSDVFEYELFVPQVKEVVIEALGHDWGIAEYEWNYDNSKLTATRICNRDHSHIETETVRTTSDRTPATCEKDGKVVYTSNNFINEAFTYKTKEITLKATGHSWGSPTYSWSSDGKYLTATRICNNDRSHIETETVSVTITTVNAICEENGLATYTSASFSNKAFSSQTKEVVINALGHNFGEVTYVWSADNTHLTASRICKNDPLHIETETVSVTITIVDPTCTTDGLITYTSGSFSNPAFSSQTKETVLPQLGHAWSEIIYTWSADNSSVTASRSCSNDPSHNESETVSVTVTRVEATCEVDGSITYTSASFSNSAFSIQTKQETIKALGHDLIFHNAKPATFDEAGWDEYYTCGRCDYSTYNERPKLERPSEDNPEAKEEIKEAVAQGLADIVKESVNQEEFLEAIEKASADVVVDVAEAAGNAYNEIDDLFSDVPEGTKIEVQEGVELTKEEAYEIIQSFVTSTIAIASAQDEAISAASGLEDSLPSDSGIDIGGTISSFYDRVLAELLAGPQSSNEESNIERVGYVNSLFINNPENETKVGVDYSVSAETYKNAIDFVETSVNNMMEAALKIRECSGESLKSSINHYISGVSVQSFRDFDREKADLEFAELAYQAILISLQETVMNSLEENYEKAKAGKSGRALSDLEEAYQTELEQVSHLHFLEGLTDEECSGCFEDVIIEVMRLKYISILNNKLDKKEITENDFVEYVANATDAETFAPIYKEIFFNWATGKESDDKVQISLQELSDAAIENTSTKINPQSVDVRVLPTEWIIISSVAGLTTILAAVYFIASRKKEI